MQKCFKTFVLMKKKKKQLNVVRFDYSIEKRFLVQKVLSISLIEPLIQRYGFHGYVFHCTKFV